MAKERTKKPEDAALFKEKRLTLFFTRGISLKTWSQIGNLEREVRLYKELAKKFKEIYFFTYGEPDDAKWIGEIPANIRVFPKKFQLPSLIYSFLIPLFYKKEIKNCDYLKTNQMDGSWAAVFSKFLFKKKLVVRCGYELLSLLEKRNREWWKVLVAKIIEKFAYSNADAIITTSQKDKEFITKKFSILGDKIKVVPNYIDTNLFKPSVSKEKKEGICYVGRMSEEKNVRALVEAMSGLKTELKIYGSGPRKEEISELALRENIPVRFMGNVANQNLPRELNKCMIFALPSFYEGNPKALLEAMACSISVIGTDVEGIREVMNHMSDGYLCGTGKEQIHQAISFLLKNKSIREKLAVNARKTIVENYSLEKILELEFGLYKSL